MPFIEITKDNSDLFAKAINDDRIIVLYHWNQCGHCQQLLPIWKKAIENVGDKSYITEIEYLNLQYLPEKYKNILGFPSIVVYNNGNYETEFKNIRNLENLEKFIKANASKSLNPDSKKKKTKK